jgi:hypothetical protein
MDDSAPWKTEETIIGFAQLPALSEFGGCHLSPFQQPKIGSSSGGGERVD